MKKKVFMLLILICCLPLCVQANTVSVTFSVRMPNHIKVNSDSEGINTSTPDTIITTEETVRNGTLVIIQTALAK
ncbi:MAG: hypothetical protein KAJ14_08035 [Candidatus Omnitrophica bacterium]|nr:hypothetical protein [Candidatus Omnitrophota bacterium]MCK5287574.1 hypothetical protein [Candidatus Omnitrophota bacterium]MCK5493044.1 hypothetical protein [Candidatus Omnitrophota bacterium]